jgi:dolichol-phosphate mannosyltransferase
MTGTPRPDRPLVSIVCPVFNEEAAIPIFYERLQKVLVGLRARYDFEIIFTNNRSTDRTLEVLRGLRQRDGEVQILTYSRNFGYQGSILGGLEHAGGDLMTIIDVDCEDPPEMLATFLVEWERGYDVVYGLRDKRNEPKWLHLIRKGFYRINRLVADSDIILDMAEFFLITRAVRDAITLNASTFPFLRSEVAYVGFDIKGIPYERQKRAAGQTHYNLVSATRFAIAGILSSSTLPLRLAAYVFFPLALADAMLFVLAVTLGRPWPFQTLVAVTLLYLAFFVSALCIYQARIYKNVVRRPLYIVDWRKSATNRVRQ